MRVCVFVSGGVGVHVWVGVSVGGGVACAPMCGKSRPLAALSWTPALAPEAGEAAALTRGRTGSQPLLSHDPGHGSHSEGYRGG